MVGGYADGLTRASRQTKLVEILLSDKSTRYCKCKIRLAACDGEYGIEKGPPTAGSRTRAAGQCRHKTNGKKEKIKKEEELKRLGSQKATNVGQGRAETEGVAMPDGEAGSGTCAGEP